MSIVLTVAIPIYKSMPLLPMTVDSVLQHRNDGFELLFIYDGYKDGSLEYCNSVCEKDPRVRTIIKESGNLPSARNYGMRCARGCYIWFFDADDLACKNSLDDLVLQIRQMRSYPDVIMSNYSKFINNTQIIWESEYPYEFTDMLKVNGIDMVNRFWGEFNMTWAVWCHIFNMEFLRRNQCVFDESLSCHEDGDWTINTFLKVQTVEVRPKACYSHRMDNIASASYKPFSLSSFRCAMGITTKWFRYFKNHERDCSAILYRLSCSYNDLLHRIHQMLADEKREAIKIYLCNKDIADYKNLYKMKTTKSVRDNPNYDRYINMNRIYKSMIEQASRMS